MYFFVVFELIFTFNDVPILNFALFLDDFCEKNRALESVYVRGGGGDGRSLLDMSDSE
jgi:hypothetical protein